MAPLRLLSIIKKTPILYVTIIEFDYPTFISECSKHCSLCYNETECYDCTHGFFLNEVQECESKFTCSHWRYINSIA